jgi:large-conductance mechanosensitive channel
VKEAFKFVRENAVAAMILGFAVGLQLATTVNTLVQGLVNPIVEWLLGYVLSEPQTLEQLTWTVSDSLEHGLVIYWGLILSGLIRLAVVVWLGFAALKWLNLVKNSKK